MLDTFQSFNVRDFRQRYNNSFGYYTVPESKKRILVFLSTVGDKQVEFLDETGVRYNAIVDTGVEFEFIPVQKKLFVSKDRLLYIRRRPARMWSRGVNTQNTLVSDVVSGGTLHLGWIECRGGFEDGPVDPLQNVLSLERKEANAIVLSDVFGVINSELYLYDQSIGSFLADRREIVLDTPMFKQEVTDLVEKHKIPYKVVYNG